MHTYANYYEKPDPSHRPMYLAKVIKSFSSIPKGANILDAGCGGGDFSIGLRDAGYNIYGLDLNPSGIEAAQKLQIGEFKVGSLYDDLRQPFGSPTISAIVAIEVIEHLYSPFTFTHAAHRALPRGGLVAVTTPYWGYIKNIAMAVTGRTDKALTALWEGGHIKHFSRRTLTELWARSGFEEVAFYGCGEGFREYTPYLWNGMLMVFRKT